MWIYIFILKFTNRKLRFFLNESKLRSCKIYYRVSRTETQSPWWESKLIKIFFTTSGQFGIDFFRIVIRPFWVESILWFFHSFLKNFKSATKHAIIETAHPEFIFFFQKINPKRKYHLYSRIAVKTLIGICIAQYHVSKRVISL